MSCVVETCPEVFEWSDFSMVELATLFCDIGKEDDIFGCLDDTDDTIVSGRVDAIWLLFCDADRTDVALIGLVLMLARAKLSLLVGRVVSRFVERPGVELLSGET